MANEEVFTVKHAASNLYDWDVNTRCRVATKKASRSLVRTAKVIKESWDTIEQYRHLMDKKPEVYIRPVKPVQASAAAAQELPAIMEVNKQPAPAKRRPVSHRRVLTQNKNQRTYLPSLSKINKA